MPTAVPALDRTMQILEVLRRHTSEPLTLSDIARATGIHKATVSSTLTTMASYDLVRRDDALRYSIGGGFVRLGHAFARQYPQFVHGREEIVRLVASTGLSCAAIARDGEDLVVLDMLGNSQPAHLYMRIGTRVPLVPPVGTIFKAWAKPDEMDAWIAAMQAEFGGERSEYLSAVTTLRARGFSLGGEHDFHLDLESALRRATRDQPDDGRVLEVAMIVADKIRNLPDLEDDATPVNSVIGPVFGPDGQVAMSLNLYGDLGSLRHRDLPAVVPALLETCARATQRAGGRLPAGFALTVA
jgi:DNA-binding IclR family transcriptional regulator